MPKRKPFAFSFDLEVAKKLEVFSFARLVLLSVILLSIIFLRQEVLGATVILQIYATLFISFFISFVNVSYWQQTAKISYYIPSQLLFDVLLTSYLVFLTGVNDSIFLFLYLFNIVFSAIIYQLVGALVVAGVSGVLYGLIFLINTDIESVNSIYNLAYSELLFLLTALLSGQLMDEIRKQRLELEQQQKNILRLEELNDQLINNIPVGLFVVDSLGYVETINTQALKLLHLNTIHHPNIRYFDLVPQIANIMESWSQLTETQRLRFNFEHSSKEGEKKYISLRIVDYPGDQAKKIFVFQDISQLLELESRLETESKLAAVGQLAAGIAHEIRNPLASISGSIEMLDQSLKPENEEEKKLLNISLREIKRLNQLITGFLEYAKPKSYTEETFSFRDKVQEVCEAMMNRKEAAGRISFELLIPANLSFKGDSEKIKQVFFNLFLNSAEAKSFEPVTIKISAWEENSHLEIEVKDDGPGIKPEYAKRIFDPFFTTKETGTGLGLSTVAQIVQGMGGSAYLGNTIKGTSIRISLPQKIAALKTAVGS